MKNVKSIAAAAILALVITAPTFAKVGTISGTKTGTISGTQTGTISGSREASTAPTINTDTLKLGIFELLVTAFQIW